MDWSENDKNALAALINGDDGRAIQLWSQSVALIEQASLEPTVEIGQVYYHLGKCLADKQHFDRAIALLKQAEAIVVEAEPASESLRQIRNDLGSILTKLGRVDEAAIPLKLAMGILDEPLASCLVGPAEPDVPIRKLIKLLQEIGIASELNAKEFDRIKKELVAVGRATADDQTIQVGDLLYSYYLPNHRRVKDKVIFFQDFNPKFDLPTLINDMNIVLGETAFLPEHIVAKVEEDGRTAYYIVVDPDDGPMAARLTPGDEWNDAVTVANSKRLYADDTRRFLRISSIDDKEQGLILLEESLIVSLYRAGAGYLFKNPTPDLEPQPPLLVQLVEDTIAEWTTISSLFPTSLSHEEILAAIENDHMKLDDGEALFVPGTSLIFKLEVYNRNEDWIEKMYAVREGITAFNVATKKEISRATIFINLEAPNADCQQNVDSQSTIAIEYLQVVARLMKAIKSPAVLVSDSNQIHTLEEIGVFERDLSAPNLVHMYTRLINDGKVMLVAGMQALGYPNIALPSSIESGEQAIDLVHEMAIAIVKRDKPVQAGFSRYQSETTKRLYELELSKEKPVNKANVLESNSNGILKFKRVLGK